MFDDRKKTMLGDEKPISFLAFSKCSVHYRKNTKLMKDFFPQNQVVTPLKSAMSKS